MPALSQSSPLVLGRYALYGEIATGGMATVHYGRLLGSAGFSRTVAIKRLHPQFARDPDFVRMFLDEARLAGRIRHPNVVPTLDVVAIDDELFLVMEYVQGESVARLVRTVLSRRQQIPLDILSAILCGALHGLHAAHEATDERGNPLDVVHRDVSPQNILVGADGVPRVLDFGVAKAAGHSHHTRDGQLKGKLSYMSPEQLRAEGVDRRTDVFASGVVLWEMLTLRRLFAGDNAGSIVTSVLQQQILAPSELVRGLPPALDSIVLRALARDRTRRFESARAMAKALEQCIPIASPSRVSEWIEGLVGDLLAERAQTVSRIESASLDGIPVERGGSMPSIPDTGRSTAAVASDGTASQLSTISVSTAKAPGRATNVPRIAIAVGVIGGFVAAAAVLTILLLHRTGASSVAATPAAAASVTAEARPVSSASTASSVPDTREPPLAASAAEPAARSGGAASAEAAHTGDAGVSHPAPAVQHQAALHAAHRAAPKCWIRTYKDSAGIEHFQKVCQ